ncbi:MAG: GGDEF domain-containing protein [Luteimonas sp.]
MPQPFPETWLFELLLAVLLATAVYALFRHEQRRHARQRQALEEEVRSQVLELHAANARLEQRSQSDPLTGLRNHRYLANQIHADLAWYERDRPRAGHDSRVLGFVLVEPDGLAALPSAERTASLLAAAQVLGTQARACDYIVRWEDGLLVVTRPLPERALEAVAARLHEAFALHAGDGAAALPGRRCSIGAAAYPLRSARQFGIGWEQVVELAGAALRSVQRQGGDGWAVLHPASPAELPQIVDGLGGLAVDSLLRTGRLRREGQAARNPEERSA